MVSVSKFLCIMVKTFSLVSKNEFAPKNLPIALANNKNALNIKKFNSINKSCTSISDRNRFPTNTGNSNMPAGILGQGPRPNGPSNNMMQQQRPGLVGNYQPRNNMNGPMNNQSQQSIMGMGNPGIMGNNNSIRPGFNSNAGFNVMQNNRTNQASLLGNRPPLVNSNSNGLIPMRPGINPALVGNNGPIGQGVGLLNNPRIPHMAQGGNMQQQRQDWDRNGQNGNGPMNGQFVNGQNGQAGVNSMMMMGQNQNSRMGQGWWKYFSFYFFDNNGSYFFINVRCLSSYAITTVFGCEFALYFLIIFKFKIKKLNSKKSNFRCIGFSEIGSEDDSRQIISVIK